MLEEKGKKCLVFETRCLRHKFVDILTLHSLHIIDYNKNIGILRMLGFTEIWSLQIFWSNKDIELCDSYLDTNKRTDI